MAQKRHAQAQARSDSVQCIPDPHRTAPALPQADANGVLDDWRWGLDTDGDIIVNVDQLENSFTTEDVITVYFGDAPPQSWMIDPNTNPPDGQPYPFYFKAGELPDGQYKVFYTITETLSGGTVFCSPTTSVTIVNSPDRQGVVVDHIGTPTINPNNQPPGGTDGIEVTVYDANGQGIPNAWVAFYGPNGATIDPPITQTDPNGQASCSVTYPDQGTITVDIWCGRKYQDANPTFGQASLYLLLLSPVTNNVYADGTQQNTAEATLESSNGTVVTDPGQQQNVIFTLPADKSATFPDGSKQATVETVGGYATVAFTDANEFGETVNLNAQLQSGLAKQPPARPFTFKAVWSLPLTPVANNAAADGTTPDVAQVGPVTRDGAVVSDGTAIQFSLNQSSSAQFLTGGQTTVVGTSGGYAKVSFVDSKVETVTISAALQQDQNVKSIPPSLPFQFTAAPSYELTFTDPPLANNQAADGSTPDEAQVVVTDNGGRLSDPVVVTFDFLSGSATFVLTGDPNIQPGSTGQTLYVQTHYDSTLGKDIANASFTDTNAEDVKVQGALKDFPNFNDTQDFTFASVSSTIYLVTDIGTYVSLAPEYGTYDSGHIVACDKAQPDDLCKFTVSSHTGGQIAAQDGLNLDVASSTVSDDFDVPYLIATSGWSLQDGTSGFRINYEDGDSKVTLQNTGLQSLPYVSRTHTLQLGGINVLAADHTSPDSTCYFKIIRVPS
ncbi:Ig-like domain-containing protein [Bradyrhizobium sp. LHD-71]|uniref:Ig-like domain-containing protein n=1 Tax=Bradyrhizobium sp. LHD-71 TaxID=3072141 RepID=UPI00280FA295|nr:Ig-like domain-containing protein [Bradyrhizobium sp. LHD-71]MDQ8730259.1 Ig-like domain-containing protein [Bradyrhizobium sp. LHD-71]